MDKERELIDYCKSRDDCFITNAGKHKVCKYYNESEKGCTMIPPPCDWYGIEDSINTNKL